MSDSGRLRLQRIVFNPVSMLAISAAATGLFALLVIAVFEGEQQAFLLMYFAPIGLPFVAFLLDRAEKRGEIHRAQWTVDDAVLVLSLLRSFVMIPGISGHALFLTYAFLTTRSWLVRAAAGVVMLQVVYLKAFVWHDRTLIGGIVVGCIAALVFQKYERVIEIMRGIRG